MPGSLQAPKPAFEDLKTLVFCLRSSDLQIHILQAHEKASSYACMCTWFNGCLHAKQTGRLT